MMTTTVFCQPKYCNRKFFLIFSARLILSCQKISLRQKIFFFWQDYPRWKKQYLINKIFNRILWMKFKIYFLHILIEIEYLTHTHTHTYIHAYIRSTVANTVEINLYLLFVFFFHLWLFVLFSTFFCRKMNKNAYIHTCTYIRTYLNDRYFGM